MPTYVYECEKCGEFEEQQSIKDPALTRCPRCGGEVRRVISGGTSFILKGGGACSTTSAGGS
jgi:putative FmdB family regulatory protein